MKAQSALILKHAAVACLVTGLFSWNARGAGQPALFTEAKITEVVKDVNVVDPANPAAPAPAKLNEQFRAPDLMQTGARSRAQLTATDGTIARVGSNTIFSFQADSRTVKLQQGSILFNSPKGGGGGTIVTNSATATVLGTTIIVAATSDGGFKILVLEGHAQVTFPGGQIQNLGPGQMTFVLPAAQGGSTAGGTRGGGSGATTAGNDGTSGSTPAGTPGPILNFDLSRQSENSDLINGFTLVLPSQPLVVEATQVQQKQINTGQLVQTNQAVIGAVGSNQVVLVDSSTISNALNSNPANQGGDNTQTPITPITPLSPLQQALTSSVSLTPGAPLPSNNIFLSPQSFAASFFGIPNGLIQNNQVNVTGLIAGDIGVNGIINLGQLDSLPEVDLFAANTHTFTFGANTVFSNLTNPSRLGIYSAGSFVIPTGATITTDFAPDSIVHMDFGSIGDINMQQVQLSNPSGEISLSSLVGNVTLNGTSVAGSDKSNNQDEVNIKSKLGAVSITGNSVVAAGDNSFGFGEVRVQAGGNVTVQDSTLTLGVPFANFTFFFGQIRLQSNANVNVTNTQLLSTELDVFGGPQASVSSANLSMATYVNMAAATLNLSDIDFNGTSTVYLWSATGNLAANPNTGAPSSPGDINFLTNVFYGGSPAEGFIGDGITLGITADNTAVQAALGQSLLLSGNTSIPSNLAFAQQVMFTPADIAAFTPNYTGGESLFNGGLIVGNLTLNGNASIALPLGNETVMTGNLRITNSSDLGIGGNATTLNVVALGSVAVAPGTVFTANFTNLPEEEASFFKLKSIPSLSLSGVTINNPTGSVELTGFSDNNPAISLSGVNINAGTTVSLFSQNNGDISVFNSLLTGNTGAFSFFSGSGVSINTSDSDSNVTVKSSTLRGDYVDVGSFSTDGGNVSIQSGLLNATQNNLSVSSGNIAIGGNAILSGNTGVNISGHGNNGNSIIAVGPAALTSNTGYVSLTADTVNIGSGATLLSGNGGMSISANHAINVQSSSLTVNSTLSGNEVTSLNFTGIFNFSNDTTTSPAITIGSSSLTAGNNTSLSIQGGTVAITGSTLSSNFGFGILANSSINVQSSTLALNSTLAANTSVQDTIVTPLNIGGVSTGNDTFTFPDITIGSSSLTATTLPGANSNGSNVETPINVTGGNVSVIGSTLISNATIDIQGISKIAVQSSNLTVNSSLTTNTTVPGIIVMPFFISGVSTGNDTTFPDITILSSNLTSASIAGGNVFAPIDVEGGNVSITGSTLSSDSWLDIEGNNTISVQSSNLTASLSAFSNFASLNIGGTSTGSGTTTPDITIQSSRIISANNTNIIIFGGNISIVGSTLASNNSVSVTGSGVLTVQSTNIASANSSITLSSNANVAINNSSLQASLFAQGIAINATGNLAVANTPLLASSVTLAGGNVTSLTGGNVSQASRMNIGGNTVNLRSVNFNGNSSIFLWSATGNLASNPNTNAASQAGLINFLSGVLYGGQPAQNFINNGIYLSTASNPSQVLSALASSIVLTDGVIIPDVNIFTQPVAFSAVQIGIPNGVIANNSHSFDGIIAGGVSVSGNVDLSQLDGTQHIGLSAFNPNAFSFTDNTTFSGLTDSSQLNLFAVGSFSIPTGINITTSFGNPGDDYDEQKLIDLDIASSGDLNLQQVQISNPAGSLNFDSVVGNVTMDGVQATAALDYTYDDGAGEGDPASSLEIDAANGGSITVSGGSVLLADYLGEIQMYASGNLTVQDSTLQLGATPVGNTTYGFIQLQANGNVLIANSTVLAQSVDIIGGPKVTVSSANISYPSSVQIASATLDLSDIDFNGTAAITLWSASGNLAPNPNTGAASSLGDINFLSGVLYGGNPAENFIGSGINLGITAGNPAVQFALTQSLTLPADASSIPGNLEFGQVMFTPADIAAFVPNYTNDEILFDGGLIVGNLTQSGNFSAAGGPAVARNFHLTTSATTDITSGNNLTLYVLGTFSVAPGATFTTDFTGLGTGEVSNYTLVSIPAFSITGANVTNPTGDINFETKLDNGPLAIGMNLTSVGITAGGNISLQTHGDLGLTVSNSTLIANNTAAGGVSGINLGGSNDNSQSSIAVKSSTLTAFSDVDVGVDAFGSGNFGGTTSIQSSTLTSSAGSVNVEGARVSIGGNSTLSGDFGANVTTAGGGSNSNGVITIGPATLTSGNGSVFLSGGNVAVSNSALSGNDGIFLYGNDTNGLVSVSSSNITSANSGVNLHSGNNSVVNSALFGNNGVDISSSFNTNVQASNLTSQTSGVFISGQSSTISNSVLSGNTSVSVYGNGINGSGISVQSSSITSLDQYLYFSGNNVSFSSSILSGNTEISVFASGNNGISVQSSNLTSANGNIMFLSSVFNSTTTTTDYLPIAVQSSNLVSPNGNITLTGGDDSIGNSTLSGNTGVTVFNNGSLGSTGADGLSVSSSNLTSANGSVNLNSGDVSVTGGSVLSGDGAGGVNINGGGDSGISVQSSTLTAANSDVTLSAINSSGNATIYQPIAIQSSNLNSTNGNVSLVGGDVSIGGNSTLTGGIGVNVNATGNVSVASVTATSTGGYVSIGGGQIVTVVNSVIVAPTVTISATNASGASLTMNNVAMNQATSISLAARTIILSNINFPGGSAVSLSSANGLLAPNPNTSASPQVNFVNFITNVNYNHSPAQNFVPTSQGGSGPSNSPIQLHALP